MPEEDERTACAGSFSRKAKRIGFRVNMTGSSSGAMKEEEAPRRTEEKEKEALGNVSSGGSSAHTFSEEDTYLEGARAFLRYREPDVSAVDGDSSGASRGCLTGAEKAGADQKEEGYS